MEKFQIRTFRGAELEKIETVEAPDLLDVIDRASPPEPQLTTEIWSRIGKVGTIGPLRERTAGQAEPGEGAEIAGVMKSRLRLMRS